MSDDGGPPRPAEDAVSLHTIADHDIYVAQEQEDADLALALSLEEEEQDRVRQVSWWTAEAEEREALIRRENGATQPYRDDPGHEEAATLHDDNLPPYRDDPDADTSNDHDNVEAQAPRAAVEEGRIQRSIRQCGKMLRRTENMKKPWNNMSGFATGAVLALVMLFILAVLLFVVGGSLSMWRRSSAIEKKQRAFDVSGSMDFDLKLTKLYPPLDNGVSEQCVRTWNEAASELHCHKDIMSTAWDKGDAESVKKAKMNIWESSQLVCGGFVACSKHIRVLREKVLANCTLRSDRFDVDKYETCKLRYFQTEELDDGPLQAVQSLEARYNGLCDTNSGWNEKLAWNTWAAELWMMWGIADGKDAKRNITYLDRFLNATSESKTIEAHTEKGTIELDKGPLPYEVDVPARKVGPGDRETVCGNSIRYWLGRKWRAFEYGAVLHPQTGIPLGLAEFNDLMTRATKRCAETSLMIKFTHYLWEDYGWWRRDKDVPRYEDESIPGSIVQLLHGLRENDGTLPALRHMMQLKGAPKKALMGLHQSLLSMPCSIFLTGEDVMKHVMPSDYRVRWLCSNECRNAVDRIQHKYHDLFEESFAARWGTNTLLDWNAARSLQNLTCKGPEYNVLITGNTPFCAPGYAAMAHPEWIFPSQLTSSSRMDIVNAFGIVVGEWARSLPAYTRKPSTDAETQRRLARRVSESVCNKCAAELLIGMKLEQRGLRGYSDDYVDEKEYARVVKLYRITCETVMLGTTLAKERERERDGKKLGLE